MILKFWLFYILSAIIITSSQPIDVDDEDINVLTELENVKKSLESLKCRMDATEKLINLNEKYANLPELKEKSRQVNKPVFDIRIDILPEHCQTDILPSNCAEATECTERSGYYNISVSQYRNQTFLAFCNYNFQQGDWLYVLRRVDGSENFRRPWSDYVEGFGKVDNEYWIGLENLYALTNYDGPQELYVYLEDFGLGSRYAKYDNFAIGNASEQYQLKILGKYSGDAGDSLLYSLGAKFSTPDNIDNNYELKQCVINSKCGWWFTKPDCSESTLTGFYYRGRYGPVNGYYEGTFWQGFIGKDYSLKNVIMMIRRQRTSLI